MSTRYLILAIFLAFNLHSSAQLIDSILAKINPQKLSTEINKKLERLEQKALMKTQEALRQLQKREEKICINSFAGTDSTSLAVQLSIIKQKYQALQNKLLQPADKLPVYLKPYLTHLDSISVALKYLREIGFEVDEAILKIESIENRIQQFEEVKQFVRQRLYLLQEKYPALNLTKQFKKFDKQAYYYYEQLISYKRILNDPEKLERQCLEILSKTMVFHDFIRKNNLLASMFCISIDPQDPDFSRGMATLQNRSQLNSLLQQQFNGSVNAQPQIRENLQQAQVALQQLKIRMEKLGASNSQDIPAVRLKPNSQKTKSFFERLEFGTNFQTQKSNNYFPVTTDLGLSMGYKLNDRSIVGVGLSYKLGWGQNWRNIHLSNQGQAFRSFIDWKLKGSFWLSGGFEMNHKPSPNEIPLSSTFNPNCLITYWQKSGLLGVSKTVSVRTKFFKEIKAQLLWDFLSYQQIPKSSPILFRVSYNF